MRDLADRITWVVVADGQKALIFSNDDTRDEPFLNILSKDEIENPPTREQAANRRGRFDAPGAGGAQRSAVDDTDWHEFEKERFAKDFAETLNKAALRNEYDRLVVFAPPQALGVLRKEFHKETENRLAYSMAKDFTNHPVEEIEEFLKEANAEAASPDLPPH